MAAHTPMASDSASSESTVRIFGRELGNVALRDDACRSPFATGADLKDARLACVYGFAIDGQYFDMATPVILLVSGPGEAVDEGDLPSAGTSPSPGLRAWTCEKGDFTLRLDASSGPIERLLGGGLEAPHADAAGANYAGANYAGANYAGANYADANYAGANYAGGAGANYAGGAGANYAGGAGANYASGAGANFAGPAGANYAGANYASGAGANYAGGAGANYAGGAGANYASSVGANYAGGVGANFARGAGANYAGGAGANFGPERGTQGRVHDA